MGIGLLLLAVTLVGIMVVRWLIVNVLPKYLRRFIAICVRIAGVVERFIKRWKKGGTST